MALDGWSNVNNEPVVSVSVTTSDGDTYLTETVDTSGNGHIAEYLTDVASTAITSCTQRFNCRIGSSVTDNAANAAKMRRRLQEHEDLDIVTYRGSADLFNLLATDVEGKDVKDNIVVHIVKYFRNTNMSAAWYKAADGKALVMPQDVRWNTMADSLESYLQNWPIMLQVCEKHRGEIDTNIANKVKNIGIKRNAEDFLIRLNPIAVAVDRVQSDTCVIRETVQIWRDMEKQFEENDQPISFLKHVKHRYNQAMTDSHF